MNSPNKIQIGLRIQAIMKAAGITQRGIANYLGVSQPAVSFYLQGRLPPADVLLKIARLGDTTIEWILTGEEKSKQKFAVKETAGKYGNQAILLEVWDKIPENIKGDIMLLLRHLGKK
jgi:transcriptional regulator with XRE-family HTH domain